MAKSAAETGAFGETIAGAYATDGAAIELGTGKHEGALAPEAAVRIPLRMMNRHGLVAGATGTGKTRTLQVIAEQLSAAGVAVFAADVKGDVSGIAVPGSDDGPTKKRARERELGIEWAPTGFRWSTSRSAASAPACRCAPPCPTSGRSCSRRC